MNVRAQRVIPRAGVGALALTASAALAFAGGPAYALDGGADLALSVSATTAATDAVGDLTVTVLNNGPDGAGNWTLTYDLSGLHGVTVGPLTQLGCEQSGDTVTCTEVGLSTGHSLTQNVPITLTPDAGMTGAAGSFTVTAVSDTDPTSDNNSASVEVQIPPRGVDLVAVAEDVYQIGDNGEPTQDPVPPGDTSLVLGAVGNVGDVTAQGVKVSVHLPEYVTFAEVEPGCSYTADNRTVTCDYGDITLIPIDQDTDENDEIYSVVGLYFPVTVASNAPGPVVLNGGTLSGFALGTASASSLAAGRTAQLPKNVKGLAPAEVKDANPDDNTAEFAVHVGAAPATGGSGGTGGGLPITGARAGLIGGIGAGVLVAGGALFLISRRRRVVLVSGNSEEPLA